LIRLVPDTNVIVSGILWRGAPYELIGQQHRRRLEFATSQPMIAELVHTFGYGKFGKKFEQLGLNAVDAVASWLARCQIFAVKPLSERTAPDPDDDWVIATALAAKAKLIVTGDKPLLGVGSLGEIRIVSVAEALELLRAV
jgi:putative PIN family toxin of toxin-antitoxin system